MSLEKTEAIVLKAFNWSESSRTVVFFSRDFGKLALVDKGGRSMKSRRGRLQTFARLELSFYDSKKESRGYVREIDALQSFSMEGDGALGRLAYGSAACELMYLLLPEDEPQRQLYDYFASYLGYVAAVPKTCLPSLFVAFFLRVLSQLGYHPSLAYCAGCGRPATSDESNGGFANGAGNVPFFADRGGVLCPSCQAPTDYYIPLSGVGYRHLAKLQNASLKEAAGMPIRYAEAAQLLEALTRFAACQTDLKTDLKSLEFLQKLKNSTLIE
ncbi:MAG TPA: DNA repair protein RecO [candidate division Zixibacteria bacterium]|nr:DNA repair protein RecO [candidate division Zixibacteria bacterium]